MKQKLFYVLCLTCIVVNAKSQSYGDSLNACWITKHNKDFNFIQKNAKKIITKNKDNCVLNLLDNLTDSVASNNAISCLETLSAIRKVSDGYVSEAFDAVGVRLFYYRFNATLKFIYNTNPSFNSPMEKIIIQGVGNEVIDLGGTEGKKKVSDYLSKKITELHLSVAQKKYLDLLKMKIFKFAEDNK